MAPIDPPSSPTNARRVVYVPPTAHRCAAALAVLSLLLCGCGQDDPEDKTGASVDVVDSGTVSAGDICSGLGCSPQTDAGDQVANANPCADSSDNDPCDDGDPCTVEDHCLQGACVAGFEICACRNKADCASQEDGDSCNGTLYCDRQTLPYTCRVNPATVVHCPAGAETPCQTSGCAKHTGKCEVVIHEDMACDDGLPCTVGDVCDAAGACEPGTNLCVCQKQADCTALGQDDACLGTYYCDLSAMPWTCKVNPASVVTCATGSDSQCVKNKCKDGTCAKAPLPDNAPCDDGDTCTENDRCLSGACAGGLDTCPCGTDADCAGKEDGNQCNGTLYCSLLTGKCTLNPATLVTCQTVTDTHCSATACVPETGKCVASPVNEGDKCDDGDGCTSSDTCTEGQCKGGTNTCVCTQDKDCAAQDDGDLCNGTMYCDKSGDTPSCKINPTTIISCPTVDDTVCSQNKCDPKKGGCAMIPRPDGTVCDADGNQCTPGDACIGGKCEAGQNVCECMTDDACKSKDDGDLCNGTLYCNKLLAQPKCVLNAASVVKCATVDDTACVQNVCHPKVGKCAMVSAVDGKPCDDGGACTTADSCVGGSCKGKPKTCDDGDACTFDTCQPGTGLCQHKAIDCDDGNLCTEDQCGAGDGKCVGLPSAGKCDDGDICTEADLCKAGACKAGTPKTCDDNQPCTTDKCDPSSGCTHVLLMAGACDDGDACTVGENCSAGGCKGGVAVQCDDDNPCTVDTCDKKSGCKHALKTGQCDDGNPCTADACDPLSGLCVHKPNGQCDRPPCLSDVDCKEGHCQTSTLTCVPCLKHSDCAAGKVCKANACVVGLQCSSSVQCKDAGQVCDKVSEQCVDCTSGADCGGGQVCVDSTCIDKVPCTSDKQCSMVCSKSLGYCVGCNGSEDCPGAWCGPAHVCRPPMCSKAACIGAVQLSCNAGGSGFGKKVCDDGNGCTADGCDAVKGCTVAPVADPAAVGKVACDDKNPCTVDVCGEGGKCKNTAVNDGVICGKGTCQAGVCRAVIDFSVSDSHACAITNDGKGWCWGYNGQGQLGNGTGISEAAPALVSGGHKFAQIRVANSTSCAIDQAGKGWCWGQGNYGQLGNGGVGDGASSTIPTAFKAPGKLVAIAPSGPFTCAVGASGEVWCAGANNVGQLGANLPYKMAGNQDYKTGSPVKVLKLSSAVEVASAYSHVCALTANHKVMCWGSGNSGQLGDGTAAQDHRRATPIAVIGLADVAALSLYGKTSCARRVDGSVWCWGSVSQPLLGQPPGSGLESPVPTKLGPAKDLIAFSTAGGTACGVTKSGTVQCWGSRNYGLVPPHKSSGSQPEPQAMTGLGTSIALSMIHNLACALDEHGVLRCWGQNHYGQLGRGTFGAVHDKAGAPTIDGGAKGLWMGRQSACIRDAADATRCWGRGIGLGFGDGVLADFAAPTTTTLGAGTLGYDSLGPAASSHRCVVKADGSVWCWGGNQSGQLMNGLQSQTGDPPTLQHVKATLSDKAVQVAVGSNFSCARLADGKVRCYGGNGAGGKSGAWVKADGPIKALAAGTSHACVIDWKGALRCFGQGDRVHGQAGHADVLVGHAIVRHDGATAVAAGGNHTCFVDDQGAVRCWGRGQSGEIGVGKLQCPSNQGNCGYCSNKDSNQYCLQFFKPMLVKDGPTKVTSLCAGSNHTCAVDGEGAVWCWGRGYEGQLGDGTRTTRDVPTKLYTYPRKAVSVHCGNSTTCALDTTGGVICWGYNQSGQVGDGSAWSTVPMAPKGLP